MVSGNYSESFDDIANWGANFSSGVGASRWAAAPITTTGTIPDGVKITTNATGGVGWPVGISQSTGIQKGSSNVLFLTTGSTDHSAAIGADLFLDFTGVTAGTLSFDWAEVNNSTGDRAATMRVYASADGITFTELTAAAVSCSNNVVAGGTRSGVALPASFNNNANARLRFYEYNGDGGTTPTGSRPKISLDNVVVTGTGSGPTSFVRVETQPNGTGTVVPSQTLAAGASITVYAIQRDPSSNFVANVAADTWTVANSTGGVVAGDLVPSGDKKSATFTAHVAGSTGIRASVAGLSSVDSGTITVVAGTPSQVSVETSPTGNGTVVPAQTVIAGRSVTMYAIRRDAYNNFVDNVAASAWTLPTVTGAVLSSDLVPAADAKSATFIGNGQGTATVRASSGGLTTVDSGLLTITQLPAAAVVISQVYGGGGNSGATYQNDFVELFNRTANPVSLNGWSVQYASSTGSFGSSTTVALPNASIPAYTYYLISLNTNGTIGSPLPTADFTNTTINMSATAGKVALANTATAIGTITWPDSRVIDLVAYGASSPFEGNGSAPTLSATTSAVRNSNGCSDTDNNAVDFTAQSPNAHSTANSITPCPPNPPTISNIGNQAIDSSATIGPISFTVNDAETAAASLNVSGTSDNQTLLPNANISFGGSGIVRNVTLHPVSGQTGSAHVTVTVTDGDNMTASTSFYLFVGSGPQLGMIFFDDFNQPDGTSPSFLGDASGGAWHTTSGTPYQLIISNQQAQVCLNITNSEDIGGTFTNLASAASGTILYVGFKLTQTALPTANGEYFLHLKDNTTSNFFCRVFASTVNAANGKFRLGLSNKTPTPPNVQFPRDLDLNTTYNVVARYKVGVGISSLWVDPSSINDVNVTATDAVTTPLDITAVGLRETGSGGNNAAAGSQAIDNLAVSTSFTDVVTLAALPPTISASKGASSLTLTWPIANGAGFTLQTAGSVNSLSWGTVPGVTTSGANYTVTVPFTSTPAFFRLKK